MTWTNFSADLEISSTYSDNVLALSPTWSRRIIVAARRTPTGRRPCRDSVRPGSRLVYVCWQTVTPTGFAGEHSRDRPTTAPRSRRRSISIPVFFQPDQVLGNDRIHWFPTIAVDRSRGRHRGNVYVAYGENNLLDGDDIVVRASRNDGVSFDAAFVNARPGADRSQWFPGPDRERQDWTRPAVLLRPGDCG